MAGGLDEAERMLAAELIAPLVVANSSLSLELTEHGARRRPRRRSPPVRVAIRQGEVIVRTATPLTAIDIEKIEALGLNETVRTSRASAAGSCSRSCSSGCCSPGSGASGRSSGTATTCWC